MSIALVIISHEGVGNALVNTLNTTFEQDLPLPLSTVDIQPDCDPDCTIKQLQTFLKTIDTGEGVLLLTDLFGATPSNIASALREAHNVRLVTGLNLPMLIRVMNYPDLSLNELAEKAVEGGQSGIIECDSNRDK